MPYILANGTMPAWIVIVTVAYFLGIALLCVLLLVVIKAIYQSSKYGIRLFDAFRMKPIVNQKPNLLRTLLKKLPYKRRIVESTAYFSDIILITENGISLFSIFPYEGQVMKGDRDDILLVKDGLLTRKVPNPIPALLEDGEAIQKLTSMKIHYYLIVEPKCHVASDLKVSILRFQNLFYDLQKTILQNTQYSLEEINETYDALVGE